MVLLLYVDDDNSSNDSLLEMTIASRDGAAGGRKKSDLR